MKAREYLGLTIASIQNLAFYLWLTAEARRHIQAGDFLSWKAGITEKIRKRL
jgi:queuine tRNA-ribosyltransferase